MTYSYLNNCILLYSLNIISTNIIIIIPAITNSNNSIDNADKILVEN